MKKIIVPMLLCTTTVLFSQKDSLDPEVRRFQVMRDSMYRERLAKESAYLIQMDESLRKARQGIEDAKQKEIRDATNQVLAQQEKTQRTRRNTTALALAAFAVTIVIVGLMRRRRNKKAHS